MKKQIFTHIGIVALLLAVACAYLSPALGGKVIRQGDVEHYEAMAYSQKAEKAVSGKTPHWNSAMFSGMPGYQITNDPPKQLFYHATSILTLRHLGLDRNIGIIFLYLLGFYVALLAFGLNPWLALIGALGFGLGSYNIIIIQAGHITKAWAIGMMAPILGGMCLSLRSAVDTKLEKRERTLRVLWGSLLFTLALILQLAFNHIQITFYTAIGCVFMAVAYLVVAIKNGRFASYALKGSLLLLGAALAFGCNIRLLLVSEEYAKHTMRGGGELTIGPDGQKLDKHNAESGGLDIEYAYRWSYGVGETYTLLVPGALGGSNNEPVGKDSPYARTFRGADRAPLYWGDQPGTSGPVYFGAIVILLAILGLLITKGPERWWMLAASLLAILLSWGHNLGGFNEWVFNNVPLYNKFRTPSMALVLANVCMALLAALTLNTIFNRERNRKQVNLALYLASGLLGVLILGVMVASSSFSYSGNFDQNLSRYYGEYSTQAADLLRSERASLLKGDSLRSLIFILLAAVILWLYSNEKLKSKAIPMALLGILILVDLWGVDRRYLGEGNFADKRQTELRRQQYDYDIDQQAAYFGDHDFRVYNLATDPFNDAIPAAFHNQIGGYSPAKLNRYQDLISFHLAYGNPAVLNMLNMRYIVQAQGNQAVVIRNPDALGNAWFVNEVKAVASPDEEILALKDFDPSTTAVVDTTKWSVISGQWAVDSAATIALIPNTTKNSDYLKYESNSTTPQFAIFSEIHYAPDWRAYIDGEPVEYIRANYLLRALPVPAGKHIIEFKNEAPRFNSLERVGLIASIVTLLAIAATLLLVYRKKGKQC